MKEENKYSHYSAKDITRYLKGELSPEDMHSMEKEALDDPFLAEAMEGYAAMGNRNWNDDLVALEQQIATGKKTAKIIALRQSTGRWWKAVAAILVIGTGTGITYWLTKGNSPSENKEQQIAMVNQALKKDSSSIPANPLTDTISIKNFIADSKTKLPVDHVSGNGGMLTPANNSYTVVSRADSLIIYKPGINKQADLAKADNTNPVIQQEKKDKNDDKVVNNVKPSVLNNDVVTNQAVTVNAVPIQGSGALEENAKRKSAQKRNEMNGYTALNRSFSAQVVGPDNAPLPFANINISQANFGTYADVKGNFRLVSTDSTINIEVRSVGYQTRNYTLRSIPTIQKIVLPDDVTALSDNTILMEKKVSGRASISRRAALVRDSVVNVEPADGWDNYRTYVDNNMDLPTEILKKELHGEVEISFEVKKNGSISNIKVDESNCDHCAEAAKKLIEQGPQWKVTKGRKATARIKLQF